MGQLLTLPEELLHEVGQRCGIFGLLDLALVSQLLRQLTSSQRFWEKIFRARWDPTQISDSRWRFIRLSIGIRASKLLLGPKPPGQFPALGLWKYATLSLMDFHEVRWPYGADKTKYDPIFKDSDSDGSRAHGILRQLATYQQLHFPELRASKLYRCDPPMQSGRRSYTRDAPFYVQYLQWNCLWEGSCTADDELSFDVWYHMARFLVGFSADGELMIELVHDNDYESGMMYYYEETRCWSLPPGGTLAKAQELLHTALSAFLKYSTHNTHLSPQGHLWQERYSAHVTAQIDSEPALCCDLRPALSARLPAIAARSLALISEEPKRRTPWLIQALDGLLLDPDATPKSHKTSANNAVAMERCLRRLAGYLVFPQALSQQQQIKAKEKDKPVELNGFFDILELGGTERTHWRTPPSGAATAFREAMRTDPLTPATLLSSRISLYHILIYYAAVEELGVALAAKLSGSTKPSLPDLEFYFPAERIQGCLHLIDSSC